MRNFIVALGAFALLAILGWAIFRSPISRIDGGESTGRISTDRPFAEAAADSIGTRTAAPIPPEPEVAIQSNLESEVQAGVDLTVQVRKAANPGDLAGLGGIEVIYWPSGNRRTTPLSLGWTEADGSLRCRFQREGEFRFSIRTNEMNSEWIPPGKFMTIKGTFPRLTAPEVLIDRRDKDPGVDIFIFEGRSLTGKVIDSSFNPVAGVAVEASATQGGLEQVSIKTITDAEGYFSFGNLLPLTYSLRLISYQGCKHIMPNEDSIHQFPFPPIQFVDLTEESTQDLAFSIGSGVGTVRGRLVDESGIPFPGLRILAYYISDPSEAAQSAKAYRYTFLDTIMRQVSDEQGYFEFNHLHSAPARIQIAPDYAAANGHGDTRILAVGPDVITIPPLGINGRIYELGVIPLTRSHTFQISGTVRVGKDEYTIREKKKKWKDLTFAASFQGSGPEPKSGWGIQRKPFVTWEPRTGEFMVSCDTPRENFVITISNDQDGIPPVEYTYYPIPDQTRENEILRYPEF